MQKLLWCTVLFVSIVLAQSANNFPSENSQRLQQTPGLMTDSSSRNLVEYYDSHDTDALQEDLYLRIIAKLREPYQKNTLRPPETSFQLLQNCLKYYSNATLDGNALTVSYPVQKIKEVKEIRYLIPRDYFNQKKKISFLQPDIHLLYNRDKSTVTLNRSYTFSFYRLPGLKSNSLEQSKGAIQQIFNLIFPYPQMQNHHFLRELKGIIYFKGYQVHEIKIDSAKQLFTFWEYLRKDGSLYFYPSKIDDLGEHLIIHGLLYVIKDKIVNIYHFGELTISFRKSSQPIISEFKLIFFPFIKNLKAVQ
jgi:hypothetical protein